MIRITRIRKVLFTTTSCRWNLKNKYVDEAELNKFKSLSEEWWNPKSKKGTGPLHSLNPVRVRYIRDCMEKYHSTVKTPPFDNMKVLDVGCGGGLLAEALGRLGCHVTGIDPAVENVGMATVHARLDPLLNDRVEYRATTIQELVGDIAMKEEKREDHLYDTVTCLEVVEHMPVSMRDEFIRSLVAAVRPGGMLFMSTINRTPKSLFTSVFIAEHLLNLIPVGTHDWSRYVTPEELCCHIEEAGMEIENISGLVIDPLEMTKSLDFRWRLHPGDCDVNYIVCATKPVL